MLAPPKTVFDFDALIVLTNPASKHAKEADERINQLKQLHSGKVRIIAFQKELLETRALLLTTAAEAFIGGKQPIIGIAGGDGTVNLVLQILTGATVPDYVRDIPIVPLGTGNANDLAWMLYGNPSDVEGMVTYGEPVRIRPLQCLITPPHGIPERHIASNYISFGAMAHGAHELNKPEVRKHSQMKTWYGDLVPDILAVRAAHQAPPFRVHIQGREHTLHDLLIGNGGRIAKIGKMPVRLDKSEMYVTAVEESWIGKSAVTLGAIKLALGILPGKVLRGTPYSFKTIDTVAAQFDGEPLYIPKNSRVAISSAPVTFCALTTKLSTTQNVQAI